MLKSHVTFRPAIPCRVISEVPKNMGNNLSYVTLDITSDLIDIDRSVYNDLDAQIKAHADLPQYNVNDLLTSVDKAALERDASMVLDVAESIPGSEDDANS